MKVRTSLRLAEQTAPVETERGVELDALVVEAELSRGALKGDSAAAAQRPDDGLERRRGGPRASTADWLVGDEVETRLWRLFGAAQERAVREQGASVLEHRAEVVVPPVQQEPEVR